MSRKRGPVRESHEIAAEIAESLAPVTSRHFAVVRTTADAKSASDLQTLLQHLSDLSDAVQAAALVVERAIEVCTDRAANQRSGQSGPVLDPYQTRAELLKMLPSGLVGRVVIGEWVDWQG